MDIKIFDEWIQPGKDLHIIRFFSSFVLISEGKAVDITEPFLSNCPLASAFYKDFKDAQDAEAVKKKILELVNGKIKLFGHFTENRNIFEENIAVPFGASEMLMFALRKGVIDAVVVVCDGAGTVIVDNPLVVQGIGARMNGLFYTAPIRKTITNLLKSGCCVMFEDAKIDQIAGIKKAVELGYKNVAVTVNACMDDDISILRDIERELGADITSLIICTTGADNDRISQIIDYADMIWSCASSEIRESAGKKAVLQLSVSIPVFVMNRKGLAVAAAYSSDENIITGLDLDSQYLIASAGKGKKIKMGNLRVYLTESKLPVRSGKEPF